MSMPENLKKTLAALRDKKKSERGRVSIYVSLTVWEKFKKNTGAVGPSRVLEKWMEEANAEAEKK